MPESVSIIEFSCGACGMTLRLPGRFSGRQGKCPRCRGVIGIPRAGNGSQLVAPRLCNSCGGEVSSEDLEHQGVEEIFCRECQAEMCRKSDSTILREVGLDLPGLQILRGDRTERESTRTRLDPQARGNWRKRIFKIAGRNPAPPEPHEPEPEPSDGEGDEADA